MINNTNLDVKMAKRPIMEKTKVYEATENAQYSHHPYLCRFNGRFIALFSNGAIHEDDAGQRAVISYSDDFKTWTTPKQLEVTGNPKSVDTACGLFVYDNVLYVYVGIPVSATAFAILATMCRATSASSVKRWRLLRMART